MAVAMAQDTAPLVRYEPQLYEGGTAEVLTVLRTVDPALHTVLLIGHNPTVSELSAQLGSGLADSDGLRTTGLAVHHTEAPWADLGTGSAPLVAAHTARSHD
jgi:phosphohistidine phosphatase